MVRRPDNQPDPREIVEALAADQGLSVSRIARRLHYRRAADRDRFLDALRAAGLPE